MRRAILVARRGFSAKADFYQRFLKYKEKMGVEAATEPGPAVGSGVTPDFSDNKPLRQADDDERLKTADQLAAANKSFSDFYSDYLSTDSKIDLLNRSRATVAAVREGDALRPLERSDAQLREIYGRYDYYRENYLHQQSNQRGKPQDEHPERNSLLVDRRMMTNFAQFLAQRAKRIKAVVPPTPHNIDRRIYTEMLDRRLGELEQMLTAKKDVRREADDLAAREREKIKKLVYAKEKNADELRDLSAKADEAVTAQELAGEEKLPEKEERAKIEGVDKEGKTPRPARRRHAKESEVSPADGEKLSTETKPVWKQRSVFMGKKPRNPLSQPKKLSRVSNGLGLASMLRQKYFTPRQRALEAALNHFHAEGDEEALQEASREGPEKPCEITELFFDQERMDTAHRDFLKDARDNAHRSTEFEYEQMRDKHEQDRLMLENCRDLDMLTAYSDANNRAMLSLPAKFEMHQNYQDGWSVRELSLKFGCHPARVKAVVWLVQNFLEDHMPRMRANEIFRLMDLEMSAEQFEPVEYGVDLALLAEAEKGAVELRYGKKPLDHRPFYNPETGITAQEVEETLARQKGSREEFVVEKRHGDVEAYWVKNWVKYRGKSALKVSSMFRMLVERSHYTGTFSTKRERLMKTQGPRAASRSCSNK